MNICKVWDAEYPWDIRVEKVCTALTNAGHTVHLTARNRDGEALRERLPEATVHRMSPLSGIAKSLDAASQFPAFFNPRWYHLIRRTAIETEADLILCRDLPLAPTSYSVSEKLGIPVVLDMAENYPAMMRDLWTTGTQRPWDVAVRNPWLVSLVERWTVPRMDHVLVVVEESRDRLVEMGISPEKITIVSNTPPRSRANESQINDRPGGDDHRDDQPDRGDDALEVVYLGLMEKARGVSMLLKAAARCRSRGVPVRLSLIGDGQDLDFFVEQAEELGLNNQEARFHGFVENREALRRVARADVGAIPHHAYESWNTTIPNKLFDYMAAGIPIVASKTIPVERVVKRTDCGRVFNDRDTTSLVRALTELYQAGQKTRSRLGRKGQQAVISHFNWEQDSDRLVSVLERII